MVAVLRIDVKRIRASLETLEDMHMIKRWRFPRPKCHEYQVTLSTEDKWGIGSKRTHSIGSKRTPLMGANAPNDGVQTPLSPIDHSVLFHSSRDNSTELLAIGMREIRLWHFGRRPLGERAIIPVRQQKIILELMCSLVGQGNCTEPELIEELQAVRDYLRESKDQISDDGRDYRAKTLGSWLAHWTDQLHRAQTYLELRKKNVVNISEGHP